MKNAFATEHSPGELLGKNPTKPEEFDLSRWSISELKKLTPNRLHRFTQHIFGTLAASRILMGRCLLAIDATALHSGHGCSDSIHYAVRHGMSAREAGEARRVARCLQELPKLTRAAETGRVSWSALKAITPKATADTEHQWLELAAQTTSKTLEKIAGLTERGCSPGESSEGPNSEPVETVLTFRVAPQVAVLFQHAVRDLSQTMGRAVSANQALELLVVHFHTGAEHADDASIEKLIADADHDVAAQQEAEEREVAEALAESEPEPAPASEAQLEADTPARVQTDAWGNSVARDGDSLCAWSKTVVKLLDNPGGGDLKILARKSSKRLRHNPKARGLTPAQRKHLLRRDGYCCSTPGCRRHLWLDTHHLIFYCHQGPTVPDNLVVVCQRYVTPHLCDVGANQHSLFPATK